MKRKSLLLLILLAAFMLTSCSSPPAKEKEVLEYKVVSVYQYVEQETNNFGGVEDTEVCYKFDYIDGENNLYTIQGFSNLEYGTQKVQLSNKEFDYYFEYRGTEYLYLTEETLSKLTGAIN